LSEQVSLPKGWIETTLQEVCSVITDGVHKTPNYQESGIPFISIKNIRPFKFSPETYVRYVSEEDHNEMCKRSNPEFGDVVLTKIGTLGYAKRIDWKSKFNIFVGLALLKPRKVVILSKFLEAMLNSPQINLQCINGANGTGLMTLPLVTLRSIKFQLPSLNEQKRIVLKIEELFSKLDNAKDTLQKVKLQLIQYRQSLLKLAFEGKLTEEWREKNLQNYDSNENRLKKILEKRNELWIKHNESLQKNKRKKYLQPQFPNSEKFPNLPNSWFWGSFDQISERVTVGHVGTMKNEYVSSGIPFLRSQNVRTNRFEFTGMKFISKKFHDTLQKSMLKPNDIVVVRSGSVGTSCVIPLNIKNANCSDLVIIKQPHGIEPRFGSYYINSVVETQIKFQKVGIALEHFNTNSVAKLPLPIPTREEQKEIVSQIEQGFSLIENTENITNAMLSQLDTLRSSILKQAFVGKLVPQDDSDESAEKLLERIKTEKQLIQKVRGKKNVK
jgi:type I restriction enzyme, S subunit